MGLEPLIPSPASSLHDSEPYHKQSLHFKSELRRLLRYVFPLLVVPPLALALLQLEKLARHDDFHFLQFELLGIPGLGKNIAALVTLLCSCGLLHYFLLPHKPVYLLDFACYRAPDVRKLPMHEFMIKSELLGKFTEESLDFQKKILQRSGIGQETYFPRAVTNVPPNPCLEEARREAEDVMFGCLDELFAKSSIKPRDIGILVVNCSVFCPTPSMCAMIVNRYKMRGNILSYNLGGMGCSAGVIAVGLAKELLTVHRRTYAVVISTENITLNWYTGNHKSMLVSNCLFRLGGCATLLSNIPCDRKKAKYELQHIVRTHKAAEDKSYWCVQQQDDAGGVMGVKLSRELMTVAGNALKANITTLGPLVLPVYEQLRFLASLLGRKLLKLSLKPYVPDFKAAFEHFCIHAGGRAVLDEVEKNLMLSERHMEPSRMTLYRFGNTSSSSIWYELAYLEAKGRIKKGDRVWQIGFGSGFKCNSAVWRSLTDVQHVNNCWTDSIHRFPVHVPAVENIFKTSP